MDRITYVVEGDTGNYAALYLNGGLVFDSQTYEMTPVEVICALIQAGLLKDVEVDELEAYFKDRVYFPPSLSDIITEDQYEDE